MNRRDAIKTMLLAAASATVPIALALPPPKPKLDFEGEAFLNFMRQEVVGKPQVLMVGRAKSGKTTLINTLKRELYPDAFVYNHAVSACFPRAGYPVFAESNLNKKAVYDIAYGGDVFQHVPHENWENMCSADLVLVALRAQCTQTNQIQFWVLALKNRVGTQGGMWRVG